MSALGDLYRRAVLDHGKRPRNRHEIAGARRGETDNPSCGDRVAVFVDLRGETLDAVSFTGEGCSILTASASMMTERLRGATRADVEALAGRFHLLVRGAGDPEALDGSPALGELAVLAALAAFPGRVPCAMLPWQALRAAIDEGR